MDALNQERLAEVNRRREELGRELLTIEEKERVKRTDTSTSAQDNWNWSDTAGDIDMAGFLAAGEAAGFNPVTWLNSGALSLYARTKTRGGSGGWSTTTDTSDVETTRTGHNAADAFKMMVPDAHFGTPTQIPKVPSMLEVLGNAGTAALSTAKDFYKQDASAVLQNQLLDKQLAALAQRAGGGGRINGTTTYGPSASVGGRSGGSGALSSDEKVSSLPYPATWERGKVEVTNPHRVWRVDTDTPNAEAGEARYAEIGSEILGLSNVINDAVITATGKSLRDWGRQAGMNLGDHKSIQAWWDNPTSLPNWKLPGFTGSAQAYTPFPGATPQ